VQQTSSRNKISEKIPEVAKNLEKIPKKILKLQKSSEKLPSWKRHF